MFALIQVSEMYGARRINNRRNDLTLPVPCISEKCIKIKIKLTFYFHTSFSSLKRFYVGLNGATKKCENK